MRSALALALLAPHLVLIATMSSITWRVDDFTRILLPLYALLLAFSGSKRHQPSKSPSARPPSGTSRPPDHRDTTGRAPRRRRHGGQHACRRAGLPGRQPTRLVPVHQPRPAGAPHRREDRVAHRRVSCFGAVEAAGGPRLGGRVAQPAIAPPGGALGPVAGPSQRLRTSRPEQPGRVAQPAIARPASRVPRPRGSPRPPSGRAGRSRRAPSSRPRRSPRRTPSSTRGC